MKILGKLLIVVIVCIVLACAGCAKTGGMRESTDRNTDAPPAVTPDAAGEGEESPHLSVSLIDMKGRQVLADGAQSVYASFSAAATEILLSLGEQQSLAAVSEDCDLPEDIEDLPRFPEPDAAALRDLGVTTVLAGENLSPENAAALEKEGLQVVYAEATSLDDIYTSIALLAQLTGKDASGLIASMQEEAQRADSARAEVWPQNVCYIRDYNEESCIVAAGESLINALIERAGGVAVTGELAGKWSEISYEALMNLDPDVMLLSLDLDPNALMLDPAFADIRAVEAGQFYSVDETLVSRPGPRVMQGLTLVQDTLLQAQVS